jgi:hypothetical protein
LLSGFCGLCVDRRGRFREDEQETGRIADPRGVEAGRPLTTRNWRETFLSLQARQLVSQPALEPRHDIRESHGTIVMAGQLLCGAE